VAVKNHCFSLAICVCLLQCQSLVAKETSVRVHLWVIDICKFAVNECMRVVQ